MSPIHEGQCVPRVKALHTPISVTLPPLPVIRLWDQLVVTQAALGREHAHQAHTPRG